MDTETLIKYHEHEHENEKIAVKGTDKDKIAKSRWFSFEFITYYFVIIYATVFAVTETVRISSPTHSAYSTYSHLLQNGWIFNRKIVNTPKIIPYTNTNTHTITFLGFK